MEIEKLYRTASRELSGKENFPGHFLYKKIEIENIFRRLSPAPGGVCLEIGCGNGFQSALLSCFYKKVVATDLYNFDPQTHTMGIALAKGLNKRLEREGVSFAACSASALPFKENTFDAVFINSVLEHVKGKNVTMEQIYRSLKPGGIVVAGVPNYTTDIFLFFHLYLYMARRAFDVFCARFLKINKGPANVFSAKSGSCADSFAKLKGSLRKNYPSFPFPLPHGDWRNEKGELSIFKEFVNSFPGKWKTMAENAGLKVTDTFALLFVPFPVFEPFSTRLWINIHNAVKNIHFKICGTALKFFSVTYCLVAIKDFKKGEMFQCQKTNRR